MIPDTAKGALFTHRNHYLFADYFTMEQNP